MEPTVMSANSVNKNLKCRKKISLKFLRISLKYRPKIFKLILNMRLKIKTQYKTLRKLENIILKMKQSVDGTPDNTKRNISKLNIESKSYNDAFTQTNENIPSNVIENLSDKSNVDNVNKIQKEESKSTAWDIKEGEDNSKSIAEQVKEAAQSALQQTGMVYVESAGMYYDYKTGYYYNSELGLYYHSDTGCYYYYSDEKKTFVFHSYPDRSAETANAALEAHQKRKAKKNKKGEDAKLKRKRSKKEENGHKKKKSRKDKTEQNRKSKSKKQKTKENELKKDIDGISAEDVKNLEENVTKEQNNKELTELVTDNDDPKENNEKSNETDIHMKDLDSKDKENNLSEVTGKIPDESNKEQEKDSKEELEDGECSETGSEKEQSEEDSEDESVSSASTATDEESVAKHHPPCMRIIVKETSLPKLKVGSLFLVTKDGGTVGREGDHHTILLNDQNVSRDHLDIKYDYAKRIYTMTDLGSKNGTILNGIRMSESKVASLPIGVIHGSTIQLGETKLLCHIHPGADTCGHCEPGLIMETEEKEKKAAYTRTCSLQRQHQLELARLKNVYKPEPLMIEEGNYNDRAKARREAVGSSHHSEKTQTADLDTSIAPDNKGFKLLQKMGWAEGEGLGKDKQGDKEPIPLVGNDNKAGLGTAGAVSTPPLAPIRFAKKTLGPATLRLASKTKMLQPPAKAFQIDDDEDDLEE